MRLTDNAARYKASRMTQGRIISLTVSFVTSLIASVSHALPINLEAAPLEIRIRNVDNHYPVNKNWQGPLPVAIGGGNQVEGAGWNASLGSVGLTSTGFLLEGSSATMQVNHWKFESSLLKKGFGMDAECNNLRASFLPGTVNIPFPQDLDIGIHTGGGRLTLDPKFDVRVWVDSVLRPYFDPATVDRVLRVEGDCKGGLQDLADKLIRARVKDMPTKDPEFYNRITKDLASEAQRSIEAALRKSLPTVPVGLDFDTTMSLRREGNDTLVVKPTSQTGDFLSTESRAVVNEMSSGNAPMAVVVLSPAALNRLILLGLTGAAAHNGAVITEDRIEYTLPGTYAAKQFTSVIGELASGDPEQMLKVRLAMPAQAKDRPNPSMRPWISATGLNAGADLRWTLTIDLLSAANDAVMATRTMSAEFVFTDTRTDDGHSSFAYDSGHWLPDESVVGNAAPELGITLDWILNSEMFKGFMQKNMTEAIAWKDPGRVDFKRVGQASSANRREAGGFFAEALILRARFR